MATNHANIANFSVPPEQQAICRGRPDGTCCVRHRSEFLRAEIARRQAMEPVAVPQEQQADCRGRPDGTCCVRHARLRLEFLRAEIARRQTTNPP